MSFSPKDSYPSNYAAVARKEKWKDAIGSHTAFSLRLTSRVAGTRRAAANVVLSPLSIHVVLSLLAAGSEASQEELLSFLGAGSVDETLGLISEVVAPLLADGFAEGGPKISFANSMWLDQTLSLRPSFMPTLDQITSVEIRHVDFITKMEECVEVVNSWVQEKTSGLIASILSPGSLSPLTSLVLANALYFNGNWLDEFEPERTRDGTFHLLDGRSVEVPFMHGGSNYVKCFDGFKVLQLHYKRGSSYGRGFSMHIYLPDAKDGLWDLVEEMSGSIGRRCLEEDHGEEVRVGLLKIPKFKLSYEMDVGEVMEGMEVQVPSELNRMIEPVMGSLGRSSILHKAVIEVHEKGTEAAAVTAFIMAGCSMMGLEKRVDFVADHPFVFAIREDISGVVLFTGYVVHPSA